MNEASQAGSLLAMLQPRTKVNDNYRLLQHSLLCLRSSRNGMPFAAFTLLRLETAVDEWSSSERFYPVPRFLSSHNSGSLFGTSTDTLMVEYT